MSIFERLRTRLKTLILGYDTTNVYYGAYTPGQYYGGDIDYAQEAGDLGLNSIVMACINWISDNFPAAPIVVERPIGDDYEQVKNHLLTQILAQPNPYYSGALLWKPTLYSFHVAGNAYWRKVRTGSGQVVQLYYIPHTIIRAVTLPGDYISYYEIWNGTNHEAVPREDIVHFRNGLALNDTRRGVGDLAAALREVYTDNEAARYSAAILRNMGVPGVIISSLDPDNPITDPQLVKASYEANFGGDNRGRVMVSTSPLSIQVPAFSPETMGVEQLRDKPEERIPALLGIHPVVVGLGAGLKHSTYSNMEEAFRAAWRNNLIPTQALMSAELTTQLLPEMGAPGERVVFDYSEVEALQENRNDAVTRAVAVYNAGFATANEVRRWVGLEPLPEGDALKSPAPAPMLPAPRAEQPAELPPPEKALGLLVSGNGRH
jgi:HK97 family phage portal protein